MLPPIGFLFPDGTIIETDARYGHSRKAREYLQQISKTIGRDLLRELDESRCREDEDIFLILLFGVAKIGGARGKKYIWYPEKPRGKVKEAVKEFKKENLECKPIGKFLDIKEIIVGTFDISSISYNETIVKGIDGNYLYNPRRDGD